MCCAWPRWCASRRASTCARRDEQADSLFVVEKGQAAVRIADPSQKRAMPLEVALIGPGEMIGELALVDGQPRSADVVAVTELKGYQLARSDFDSMRAQLTRMLVSQLRYANRRLFALTQQHDNRATGDPRVQTVLKDVARHTMSVHVDGYDLDEVEVIIPDGLRKD